MRYAIDFFNSLCEAERTTILEHALKSMKKTKVAPYLDKPEELKAHLFLMERISKHLNNEDYGGYGCDIVDCKEDAVYYNSDIGAFYCERHN
jgi:hypothetical protein